MSKKELFLGLFKTLFIRLLLVTFILITLWGLIDSNRDWKSENDKYVSVVGTKVILNGDTLTVIGYSIVNQTYRLSNNLEVSSEYIKKYRVKK